LDKKVIELYQRAGKIAQEAMKFGLQLLKPKAKLIDICERIEKKIRDNGGLPAFPVNISINNVAAHYTSPINDTNVLRRGMLVKLDIGVHVNGYIADMARSTVVGNDKKYRDLIKASQAGLTAAEEVLRDGVSVNQVGIAIEKAIKSFGYTPVKDLTGHSLERYQLHAGISVPNVDGGTIFSPKLREGMAVAIEPFATTGTHGTVYNGPKAYIFSLTNKADRFPQQKEFIYELKKRFNGLPFASRWIRWLKPKKVESILNVLAAGKAVYKYHVLYDHDGGLVSQHENTYIITKNGFIKTTET